MESLRTLIIWTMAFAACVVLGMSEDLATDSEGMSLALRLAYSLAVIISLVYFHWLLRRLLLPLQALQPARREYYTWAAEVKYSAGYLAGLAGTGYVVAGLWVVGLLAGIPPEQAKSGSNILIVAVLLIAVQTLLHFRAVMKVLVADLLDVECQRKNDLSQTATQFSNTLQKP